MLKRDVYIPAMVNLLQPKLGYVGDVSSLFSLEMVREAYMLVEVNLKRAVERQPNKSDKRNLKVYSW